jgi:nitrogen regulatory protein PII
MTEFIDKSGFSLVTLIIPQARLPHCLSALLSQWPYKVIQFDCRGTIVREHWFQAFLPIMNPESEFLQFIVNDSDVEAFMQFCIEVNELHLPASGAIFSSKCLQMTTNAPSTLLLNELVLNELVLNEQSQHEANTTTSPGSAGETVESPVALKNNLYAIYALIQSGRTDNAIKAAMQAGSHGPVVYFVEGRGTRDRVGWLKITKKPYEEVVMVLVEDIDRERIKGALITAGRVNTPGGGIIFEAPVGSGLVNLPTSVSQKNYLASNEQMTAAIDQLMGNRDWRDTRSMDSLMDKTRHASSSPKPKQSHALLCALIPRKHTNEFLDQVLIIGIPGANLTYAKLFSNDDDKNTKGLPLHHEIVQIRMVLPKDKCAGYRQQLQAFAQDQGYQNVTFYELAIDQVVRYQVKTRHIDTRDAVYRGVSSVKGSSMEKASMENASVENSSADQ